MKMEIKLEYSDPRGDIYSIAIPPDQELMLFFCKAGYLRGGHSHDVPEVVLLLSGRMKYHKVVNGEDDTLELGPGEVSYNLPGQPHMGEFLEDSWLIEWKIGTKVGDWTTTDYEPYRAMVRERMG